MSRRHHDKAVRILLDTSNQTFYLRDLGGRQVTRAYVGTGFNAIEMLTLVARKRFPGEQILISSTVMLAVFAPVIEAFVGQHRAVIIFDAFGMRESVARLRTKLDLYLKAIGYITIDEYDAVRAILDAGEIEALPDYLASLAAFKGNS